MQDKIERAKVKAFYYQKVVETGSHEEATKLIEANEGLGWSNDFIGREPNWSAPMYRIKPETVMHKGGEYPKPCYSAGEMHSAGLAYFPNFTLSYSGEVLAKAEMADCQDINNCEMFASTGLYHLTRKAAIAHAKVIYQIED